MTDQQRHEAEMTIDYTALAKRKSIEEKITNNNLKWKQHLKEVVDKSIADGSYMMVSGTHFQNPNELGLT